MKTPSKNLHYDILIGVEYDKIGKTYYFSTVENAAKFIGCTPTEVCHAMFLTMNEKRINSLLRFSLMDAKYVKSIDGTINPEWSDQEVKDEFDELFMKYIENNKK